MNVSVRTSSFLWFFYFFSNFLSGILLAIASCLCVLIKPATTEAAPTIFLIEQTEHV